MQLREATFREPDILVSTTAHLDRFGEQHGEPADLVVAVVSDDAASRMRGYEDKRRDSADAGVPERGIIDPVAGQVTVLGLSSGESAVPREHGLDTDVSSRVLPGFPAAVGGLLGRLQARAVGSGDCRDRRDRSNDWARWFTGHEFHMQFFRAVEVNHL